jgi:hypothetical protein
MAPRSRVNEAEHRRWIYAGAEADVKEVFMLRVAAQEA